MDDLGFGPYQGPPERASTPTGVEAAPRSTSRSIPGGTPLVAGAIVLLLALGAFYVLVLAHKGGEAVAAENQQALDTAGQANDLAAQGSLQLVLPAAATAKVESGSLASLTPDVLEKYEPSLTWTANASSGSTVVSVASSASAFAAAALSDSGTCLWIKQSASGTTTFGSGEPCTGQAAMAATAASW
jgi:hypothetical protein